ncbi:hypothetical protein GBW32_12135 [Streptomyces tsukubensis]|uniref:hypothetical protein n=1 Tax=Streptomyces tsukubensis TaxID=83656 RepID=UPI001265E0F2|nr:hypothetical protein [Streptomyces tsukubensis]QFR93696.1 hypothetical protein GBW32_12135 [Streptomyces tsukubensis]
MPTADPIELSAGPSIGTALVAVFVYSTTGARNRRFANDVPKPSSTRVSEVRRVWKAFVKVMANVPRPRTAPITVPTIMEISSATASLACSACC